MRASQYQRLLDKVRLCDPQVILQAANHCDGHGIFDPKLFVDAGLPAEVVEHLTRDHASDGSPKGTVFVDGRPVKKLRGVYGLHMLEFLASALNVKYPSAIGRGFQARAIQRALQERLSNGSTPAPAT